MADIQLKQLRMGELYHSVLFLLLVIFFQAGLRLCLQLTNSVPFNSDEAVVALMARHILAGESVPIFFYGQSYMGSLDAILLAAGFVIFGQQVWVIRFLQFLLYALLVVTTYMLARKITGSLAIARLSILLMIVPTVNVQLYTTVTLGGYGEALVIGNLILILAYQMRQKIAKGIHPQWFFWLVLGFLCGFGFWVFGLTLVFSFSAAFYLFWFIFLRNSQSSPIKKGIQYLLPGLIGLVFGLAPIILSTFSGNFPSILRETLGSVIASPDSSNYIRDILNHSLWLLLFGIPVTLGLRPPWEMRWIALPLIPFVIIFWGAIFISYFSRGSHWKHKLVDRGGLLLLVILFTILGFILTPFGNDPSGRYFLPLFVPMCIFASTFIVEKAHTWPPVIWLFPLLIMTYHAWGIFSAMILNPPGLTTQFDQVTQIDRKYDQDLVKFLLANDITHGYTNYWVAYPLAFLSAEEVIFVPKLPYHTDFRYTSRDNRYQPYNVDVDNAARAAYITTNFPELNQYLRDQFIRLQITWSEREIGDYLVFYNISRHVRPGEVGLGIDR